jgi:hypothetical protein
MSKKLENTFKEKLENFEMPYDSGAWDQFSKRLDSKAPTQKSFKTLQFASLIIGAAVIVSVIYFVTKKEDKGLPQSNYEKELIAEQIDNQVIESNESVTSNESNSASEHDEDNNISTDKSSDIPSNEVIEKGSQTNIDTPADKSQKQNKADVELSNKNEDEISRGAISNDSEPEMSQELKKRFIAGSIINDEICEGEYIRVENNDTNNGFVRIKIANTDLTIPSGQFTEIKLSESDNAYFLNEKGDILESYRITVHTKPQVDFTFEANLYEKGLPVTFFDAYGSFKKYEWDFGNELSAHGAQVESNFYNKGNFEVSLKVTDHNNCTATKKRNVLVENDYNLMASNAFRPYDNDARTNTFMPYALKQRDVEFEMVIVDPKSHAVIYKSNDATKGWDGTDQRTGQMTPANKTYVWKVHLENPQPGEKAIYMGTVLLNK